MNYNQPVADRMAAFNHTLEIYVAARFFGDSESILYRIDVLTASTRGSANG